MAYNLAKQNITWRNCQQGATAIEFSLIALPLLMLLIGVLELAMFYARATVLEGATAAAARVVRTGEAQKSVNAENLFKQTLCAQVNVIMKCSDVIYEVIKVANNNFTAANNIAPTFDSHGNLISHGFTTGASSDVVVRTSYRYHFATPFLGPVLSGNATNSKLMMATIAMRNEPYEF
jgi:Flp pilus assembly protein TadG